MAQVQVLTHHVLTLGVVSGKEDYMEKLNHLITSNKEAVETFFSKLAVCIFSGAKFLTKISGANQQCTSR
jgi:hypothetical protein